LVVGDYFKQASDILRDTEEASDLITWLRSKTIVLGLLTENQQQTKGDLLTVIRAVISRWTAHLRAYERLLLIRPNLIAIVYADEAKPVTDRLIVTGDTRTKAKSTSMCNIIKNNHFWHSLTRVVRHLRPLGISANIIQAAFCRLDTVLLTFGYLVWTYRQMNDAEDIPGRDAIIRSIEQRWEKTDQQVFIAAVILNPFTRLAPFGKLFNNADVIEIISRLWQRFNRTQDLPTAIFLEQLSDYLTENDKFSPLRTATTMRIERTRAEKAVSMPFYSSYIYIIKYFL
ncbi:hypothetical protein BJ912DRAFT_866740, partial [Pholiota molesta]